MKRIIFVVSVTILQYGCSDTKGQTAETLFPDQIWNKGGYSLIEKVQFDMDDDKILDTISFFKVIEWNDPGDFQKICLTFSSGKETNIYNLGDWINMSNSNIESFQGINRLPSERLLVVDLSTEITAMIIFGYPYASSPGKLTVLNLNKGNPYPFFQSEFDLKGIEDLDNDGVKEIIGLGYYRERCCYDDSIAYGLTYMPYHILKAQKGLMEIDLQLTEEFNNRNYCGFFGLEYDSEDRYLTLHPKSEESFKPYFHFEKYRKYPQVSLKYFSSDDLKGISKEELRLMRNEIFAFHGFIFESSDLTEYFSKFDWYKPTTNEVEKRLNSFEKANIKLIRNLEN